MNDLWDIFVNEGTVKAYLEYKMQLDMKGAYERGETDGDIQGQGNRSARVRGGGGR